MRTRQGVVEQLGWRSNGRTALVELLVLIAAALGGVWSLLALCRQTHPTRPALVLPSPQPATPLPPA